MNVIVESERDKRTLEWLIAQVGEVAVQNACAGVVGARKPYVSNIAKILGLTPPDNVRRTSVSKAREQISSIKDLLRQHK